MATFATQLSCFFFIVLSTCCQTEARESKFFSKYVHLSKNTKNNYVTLPLSSPSPAPTPITSQISSVPASAPPGADHGYTPAPLAADHGYAPAPTTAPLAAYHGHPPAPTPAPLVADHGYVPAPLESEIPYYGLYAKDTNEKSTTVVDHKEAEEFPNQESSNNVDNAFWASNQKGYNTNGYDSYHEDEPQGMSDTRLVDSGKYYYDVENEKYSPSKHDFVGENKEGYYYGNYREKSKYEFDSMEEYEKQEGYPDVEQDQFIP